MLERGGGLKSYLAKIYLNSTYRSKGLPLVQLVPVRVSPNDLSLILIQGVDLPLGLVKMGVDHKWKELKTTLKNIENPHALG